MSEHKAESDDFVWCDVRWLTPEANGSHLCGEPRPDHTEHRCCCGTSLPPDDPICNERGEPESECPPHCSHGSSASPGKVESGPDVSALTRDVVEFRTTYVNGYVERRINHREGDFTDEEWGRWERDAHETWRRQYPALAALLPSHLTDGTD